VERITWGAFVAFLNSPCPCLLPLATCYETSKSAAIQNRAKKLEGGGAKKRRGKGHFFFEQRPLFVFFSPLCQRPLFVLCAFLCFVFVTKKLPALTAFKQVLWCFFTHLAPRNAQKRNNKKVWAGTKTRCEVGGWWLVLDGRARAQGAAHCQGQQHARPHNQVVAPKFMSGYCKLENLARQPKRLCV
jgi:hypothetical protein